MRALLAKATLTDGWACADTDTDFGRAAFGHGPSWLHARSIAPDRQNELLALVAASTRTDRVRIAEEKAAAALGAAQQLIALFARQEAERLAS